MCPRGFARIGNRDCPTNDAESIAIARKCVGVWLDTYEFQAPAFYEKLGYEVFVRLPQYPRGYERIFLKKIVDSAARDYSGATAR